MEGVFQGIAAARGGLGGFDQVFVSLGGFEGLGGFDQVFVSPTNDSGGFDVLGGFACECE